MMMMIMMTMDIAIISQQMLQKSYRNSPCIPCVVNWYQQRKIPFVIYKHFIKDWKILFQLMSSHSYIHNTIAGYTHSVSSMNNLIIMATYLNAFLSSCYYVFIELNLLPIHTTATHCIIGNIFVCILYVENNLTKITTVFGTTWLHGIC